METARATDCVRNRSDELGVEMTPPVRFTASEKVRLAELAANLHAPKSFVLVLQVARLMSESDGPASTWITSEAVFARLTGGGRGYEAQIAKTLFEAFDLGILHRKESIECGQRVTTKWRLSEDGKRFLFIGIRAREKLRELSGLTDAQICEQIEQDEISEWRQDAIDRGQIIAQVVKDGGGIFTKRATDGGTITRAQFARTIAAKNIKRTKDAQSGIDPIWADLLR